MFFHHSIHLAAIVCEKGTQLVPEKIIAFLYTKMAVKRRKADHTLTDIRENKKCFVNH